MGALIDLTGLVFDRLTVVEKRTRNGDTRAYWLCRCVCGNETIVSGKSLRRGATRSCGCLAKEWSSHMGSDPNFIAKRAVRMTKHGHKQKRRPSPEYKTWIGIKRRCYDTKCKDYWNWGARGIVVCDRWNVSFKSFITDMGKKPTPDHQIDRLDPNGPYSPDNCRWVLPSVQGAENRRNLVPVSINGQFFPSLSAACRYFGVNKSAANYRIRAGIPIELAVTANYRLPPRRQRNA